MEENAGISTSKIRWCDPRCEYSQFPEKGDIDGSRSCQTYLALYCSKLNTYVTRNAPCQVLYGARRPKSRF